MRDQTDLTLDHIVSALAARGLARQGQSAVRLSGRQTNSVWRIDAAPNPLICKVYSGAHTPLFANDPEREAQALAMFAPLGLAPQMRARFDISGTPAVAYDFVSGDT